MTLFSNAKWNTLSQVFKICTQLINLIYLAKIIPPSEYGIMAMAVVITNFGILLRDLGTSAAIIQRKILTENIKKTIFWLNTLLGFLLAVVIIFSSPVIASIYHQPELIPVLMFLSLVFPLSSCAATHLALMERESKFKLISMIEVISSLASVIVAVVLANLGFGVYSLVGQAIVMNFTSAILFWYFSTWRPGWKMAIRITDLKDIFGFSANLSLFNLINYLSRNADSFIIGKYMAVTILGSYNLAYRIMLFPLQSLTFVATRSLYPILSRSQEQDQVIKNTYYNCVFVILLITAPLMSGIAIYSKPFIFLLFGPQWYITADVLKWLAPTAIIQSVLSTTGAVFMAKGKTDILMRLGVIGAILQVGAFLFGVHFSITTFTLFYLIANILNFFPVMYFLLKLVGGDFFSFFNKIKSIFISTVGMIVALKMIDGFMFGHSDVQSLWCLTILGMVGFFCYFTLLMIFSFQIRRVVFAKFKKHSNTLIK